MTVICWAVRLSAADARGAVRLWRVAGVEVCAVDDSVWLRGRHLDEVLAFRLRSLPGAQRFSVLPDGQLCSPGARTPRGWLPQGPWMPLSAWLVVEPPVAGLAGRLEERIALRLVRSTEVAEPGAMLTQIAAWQAYVHTAPQVRLDRWRFAAAADGRALVCGQPLPPIPGVRLVDRAGILTPAGWTWSPPVEAVVVRAACGIPAGALLLWHADGRWERVPGDDLVRATRCAVRQTTEVF